MAKALIGRPPKFKPKEHLEKISKFMETGPKNMAQVAAHIGVNRTTLWRWSKDNPELNYILEVGKTAGEAHMTDVLYNIAVGNMKGNPTAAMMILNNCYGWQSTNKPAGNTINIQNNVQLTYNEVNEEIQKYLDKMGVKNLKDVVEDDVVDGELA